MPEYPKGEELDKIMRTLLNLGDLRTENIIEIQYILKLIFESNMRENDKQNCGKCINMLIMLSNLYLKYWSEKMNNEPEPEPEGRPVKSCSSDDDHDL